MSTYTLEVVAPQGEDELVSALDAIAIVHGGAVVGSFHMGPLRRRFVNIFVWRSAACFSNPL